MASAMLGIRFRRPATRAAIRDQPERPRPGHEANVRTRRQYALAERARLLGWSDVVIIDDDLGVSAGGVVRPGFERLLAAICSGEVGAVGVHRSLPPEAQRLRLAHAAGVGVNVLFMQINWCASAQKRIARQ